MRKKNYLFIILLILIYTTGCSQEEITHEHQDDLSGIWKYYSVSSDSETNEFFSSHVHVEIIDEGQNILLDQCLRDKTMQFTRNENILTNENGLSLEIIHDDKIESINLPAVSHLLKSTSSHELKNAGSITIKSDVLPNVSLVQDVCAQRIIQTNDDKVIINLSFPFLTTFMDVELEVSENSPKINNLIQATFYSPEFMKYYGSLETKALYGQVNFVTLSEKQAMFNFDITLAELGRFPGDILTGSVNVRF